MENDSQKPLVSIITVVYNGDKYLEQTILSVLNQTYSNIEYIIIDGGSKDKSVSIIKKYDSKISYWISEKDTGIYDAMNKGINMANGEIIGIINSDDWYEPDCIQTIVNYYLKNNEFILYGLMRHFVDDQPIEIYSAYHSQLKNKMLPHSTCFVPAVIYNKYGTFNLSYKYCADYEFLLRLYKEGIKFMMIEKVLANFRLGGVSFKYSALKESFNMRYRLGYLTNFERISKILGVLLISFFRKL